MLTVPRRSDADRKAAALARSWKRLEEIGDVVDVGVEVVDLTEKNRRVRLHCECRVGDRVVLDGEGVLSVPPTPKLKFPAG